MSTESEETRLAREWERAEAVDCSCAGSLPMLFRLLLLSDFEWGPGFGLDSVFNRRRMPETAYETGYVK